MLRSMQKLMRTIAAYFCSKLKRNAQRVRPHYAIQHWKGGWGLVFQRVSSKIVAIESWPIFCIGFTISSFQKFSVTYQYQHGGKVTTTKFLDAEITLALAQIQKPSRSSE